MKQKTPHGKVVDPQLLLPDTPEEIQTLSNSIQQMHKVQRKQYLKLKVEQDPLVLMQMAGRES